MRIPYDIKNLVTSLILYEKVKTTLSRAKRAKKIVERLISKAKKKRELNARRYLLAQLSGAQAAAKVLEVFKERYKDRTGGYLRIIKIAPRKGDNAAMAKIEFLPKTLTVSKKAPKVNNAKS